MQDVWPPICRGRKHRVTNEEHRVLVERLLCGKISLHGICRVIGGRIRWLMDFMVACFTVPPEHLHIQPVMASREVLLGCLRDSISER